MHTLKTFSVKKCLMVCQQTIKDFLKFKEFLSKELNGVSLQKTPINT